MRERYPDAITLAPISPISQFSKISEKFKKMEQFVRSPVSLNSRVVVIEQHLGHIWRVGRRRAADEYWEQPLRFRDVD